MIKGQEKLVTPMADERHINYPSEEDLLQKYAFNNTYKPSALAQRLNAGEQQF